MNKNYFSLSKMERILIYRLNINQTNKSSGGVQMKYSKKDISIENGLAKEWIITNGIGGYASSTIIGANTRKYHRTTCSATSTPCW